MAAIALFEGRLVADAVCAKVAEPQGRRLEAREAAPPSIVVLGIGQADLKAKGVDSGEARDVREAYTVVALEQSAPEEA